MTSSFLREDIREVFNIFDEEGSGTITIQEVGRALHTITGQRVPRSELLKLIVYAEDVVAREAKSEEKKRDPNIHQSQPNTLSTEGKSLQPAEEHVDGETHALATADSMSFSGHMPALDSTGALENNFSVEGVSSAAQQDSTVPSQENFMTHRSHLLDGSDGIDIEVFEQLVLHKLNHRSYEEELEYIFDVLQDKSFVGFITKESIRHAAVETREPLTETEIAEMFDPLVTGVSTAALDLSAFTDLQLKARKAEES